MRLGLVTYLLGSDWDLPTLLDNCAATGFEGVELRTTHAHGVEVTLRDEQRAAVRRRFENSPIELVTLGSACEYHSADAQELARNIELTKQFVVLAHDVGASGVKVRPNGAPEGVPLERTLEQIGRALAECGRFADGYGVEIRLEVHGPETSRLENIRTILEIAEQPNVVACWNSNAGEVQDGSIARSFRLVQARIGMVHVHDLYDPYPYRELFRLLGESGYDGWTMAECPASSDAVRVMRYYSALWRELIHGL